MAGWHIAATVCGFISLLLLLTALGSHHWLEVNDISSGLWELCTVTTEGIMCADLGMNVKGNIHATRAFLILGVFPGFISCGSLCLLFFRSEIGSYSIYLIALISSHVAGILSLIAMSIFTGSAGTSTFYGWSYVLGWACVALFHITGGLSRRIPTYTAF